MRRFRRLKGLVLVGGLLGLLVSTSSTGAQLLPPPPTRPPLNRPSLPPRPTLTITVPSTTPPPTMPPPTTTTPPPTSPPLTSPPPTSDPRVDDAIDDAIRRLEEFGDLFAEIIQELQEMRDRF
jgi:hypothetical protein